MHLFIDSRNKGVGIKVRGLAYGNVQFSTSTIYQLVSCPLYSKSDTI